MFALSSREFRSIEDEISAARRLGFHDLAIHTEKTFSFETSGYLEIPQQAMFYPLKFLAALRRLFVELGGVLYEMTEATDIKEEKGNVIVTTAKGTITARHGVIATYQPFYNSRELFARKGMYISYVLEVELPKGTLPHALYLDQANPYHYFRIEPQATADRMIIGGEDHRKEIPLAPEKSYAALEEYLQKLLPNVPYTIIRRWEGGILEPVDGLAYIGRFSKTTPHLFVATGFSGNGMTYSSITSMIIRDLVLGRKNPYAEVYDASRSLSIKALAKKARDFTGEFFGGAVKNLFK